MVNPEGNTESILNLKKIMRKKKIHLVQKGPDQGICPKIGSRKGDVKPKMVEMKMPVVDEGCCSQFKLGPSVSVYADGLPK